MKKIVLFLVINSFAFSQNISELKEQYKNIDTLYFIFKKENNNRKYSQLKDRVVEYHIRFSNGLSIIVSHIKDIEENKKLDYKHKKQTFKKCFLRKHRSQIISDKIVSKLTECELAQGILNGKTIIILDMSEKIKGFYQMYEVTTPYLCRYDD
ncbi:hypothetical protein [Flavobacterium sp.]|uniref:hypothetical protein n=1 Tax=Flavobacterium sp. TaxID=239 RepID=UPI002FD8EDBC